MGRMSSVGIRKIAARRKLLAFGGLGAMFGLAREARVAEATHQAEDLGLGIINPSGGGNTTTETRLNTSTGVDAFSVHQAANTTGDAINGYAGTQTGGAQGKRGVYGQGGDNSGSGSGGIGIIANGGSVTGTFDPARVAGDGLYAVGGTGFTSGGGGNGVYGLGGNSRSAPGAGVAADGGTNDTAPLALGGTGVLGRGGVGAGGIRTGIGVLGQSGAAEGIRGESFFGPGALGVSTNYTGVYAQSANNWGLYAQAPGYAGVFQGSVYIAGGLKLLGGFLTAIKHPDGSSRAAHGVTSPDPVIEDFGRARLTNGAAHVALDPAFAALIQSADYTVFPVPEGDCNGLYISNRSSAGFDVRELKSGSSTLDFGYRVVARRRDADRTRLAKLERLDPLPSVKHTDVPAFAPEPPRRNASENPGTPSDAPAPRR